MSTGKPLQAAMGWTNCHLYEIRAATWAGGCPIPTSEAVRSTPARPG
jgi:hypothetical protein